MALEKDSFVSGNLSLAHQSIAQLCGHPAVNLFDVVMSITLKGTRVDVVGVFVKQPSALLPPLAPRIWSSKYLTTSSPSPIQISI
jgi:hypothetical protein